MSIDDYVTVNEGKDSSTITAQLDLEQVKKAGKDIHYVATHLVNSIYNNCTSTSISEELLGNEYNTHEIHSERGKFVAQKGQIKYNSFWDGILRPAEKTDYEIVVDEANGTINIAFKNEGHGDYAKRAAKDAIGAMRNYHFYFESGEKEEKKDPAAKSGEGGKKPAETIDDVVEGDPKGEPPKADAEIDKNSEAYKGLKDIYAQNLKNQYEKSGELLKDLDGNFEKFITANPQELKKYEEAMTAKAKAEAQKEAAAKPVEDKKDGAVKKK